MENGIDKQLETCQTGRGERACDGSFARSGEPVPSVEGAERMMEITVACALELVTGWFTVQGVRLWGLRFQA